jgi:4-hydroxy-tetrahydrodipicolinate reductase
MKMKITLIGYGKMGRLLKARLIERGHEIIAIVDPAGSRNPAGSGAEFSTLNSALDKMKDSDAAIEFTLPDAAADNLLFLAKNKIPVVSGTTGWFSKLPEITKAVEAAGSSLVWSSNFSLGVNLFYRIASYAAKLADPFKEYDVAGFETHHNNKADSPSGTAKTLVERVLAQMTRKKKAVYEMLNRKPEHDELHYASVRVGSVPGTHNLFFDSAADTIEITHTARSREGFAAGAVLAAEWLVAKKRSGVFTIDDVLAEILP